jgi:cobalamin biosynthesis Co2+ chelatase CbiK
VYSGILRESVRNLDQILLVVNSFKTQMTDAKRIEIISKAGDNIDKNYSDLKALNAYVTNMSMRRAKDKHDLDAIRKLYGF